MSCYAYVIANEKSQLPEDFLNKFKNENLIVDRSQKGFVTYFFSKMAHKCRGEAGYFKGYYVDHENRNIGFSQTKNMSNSYFEGCFINIEESKTINDSSVSICADVFGVMPVLYSVSENFTIVSDSLFFIKKIREALGFNVNLDYENLISRLYVNALTSQSLSSSTTAEEIKYAPPGSVIHLTKILKNGIKFRCEHIGAKQVFKLENISYEDSIRQAADQLSGFLGGIINSKIMPCSIDLSGGLDSRLVLAGASDYFDYNNLSVGSHIKNKVDFKIASEVCNKFGLKLNPKDKSVKSRVKPGSMWMASNAGFYDSLYATVIQRIEGFKFGAGGHGAEVFKGNYGWRKISNIGIGYENNTIYSYLQSEMRRGLEEFGIDPEDSIGSEWHFLAYRNAIHASRGTQLSNFYLRPLHMKSLVHNMKAKGLKNKFKHNPVSDMLIYLNPELAQIGFDNEKKNIKEDDINRVANSIGVYRSEKGAYKTTGVPNTKSEGYMFEVLNMADNDGFNKAVTHENFLFLVNNSALPNDSTSQYWVNYLFNYIFDDSGKITSSRKEIAISKILSLNLFCS